MSRALLLLTAILSSAVCLHSATYYVATNGNDSWTGTLPAPNATKTDGPFASLEKARDAVRAERKGSAATKASTVEVREGVYALSKTLAFEPADSGTPGAPVVFKAYGKERPTLMGGKPLTGFTQHQGQILKTDTAAQGLKGVYFRQLLFEGRRQHLARYPNFDASNPYGGGWAYADGKPVPMYQDIPGESKREFQYKTTDARNWANPKEGQVFVFARYNWWNNIVAIAGVDPATRKITLTGDASYPIRPTDRYFVQNLLEELDAPGEWYLDKQNGTLYFWPPEPLNGRPVYAPTLRTIVEFRPGTSHVTMQGFTFECAEGTAITLRQTTNCVIAASTIRNVGDYNGSGVSIDGGFNNGVAGCDIYEIGSHGVSLNGGDRKTLTAAGNYADNNYIHHIGVFYKQGVGISMSGVGNRASHNYIHDGPRMGIMFSGNNLILEYNHIRHMNLETEDTGAVYTGGRDWISSRGSVIRYNYFHDMLGYGQENGVWKSPHFAWGVYLDDNTGGVDVYGNIIARCSRAGIHLHNGRDNHIENNILVENGLYQFEYSGWTTNHSYWSSHLPTMIQGYESVAGQPAWKNMRNMTLHPTNAPLPDGKIMTGNVFVRNIVSYTNKEPGLVRFGSVPSSHNVTDSNLVFHAGLPMKTGIKKAGPDIGGNLVPNPGFTNGTVGQMPTDWQWQVRPKPTASATLVSDPTANGGRALKIDAAFAAEKKTDNIPIVISKDFAATPGKSYRIKARLMATTPDAKASLMLQSYIANVYFWASYPNEAKVGTGWKEFEFVFTVPGPGEKNFHPQMKRFVARVDYPGKTGSLMVDDVSVVEVSKLDEWAGWQSEGMDQHSIVADPLFQNLAKDDYRLKPGSPASKIGFKPIPVEKIGPYNSPQRATWPIIEAQGAREKPLVQGIQQ